MNLPLIKSIYALLNRSYFFRWPILMRSVYKTASWSFSILVLFSAFISVAQAQESLVGFTSNGGPEGKGTLFSVKTNGTGYSVLKGFADWGKQPEGNLVKGDDGNFYGLTSAGGTFNGYGTVFKVTSSGDITVLHQFNYTTDGGYPHGSLVKGADGNFYGLTSAGGSNTYGTIFKITPSGTFTVIKNFEYSTGAKPNGHLTVGKDGNFYGMTYNGGTNGTGVIFKLTPGGTYSVLHHFNKPTDGGNSYGSLTQGKDGNFYGMTYSGGTFNYGTIFRISSTGTFKVVHHLQTLDGTYPDRNNLVSASDGNLYGMIRTGGNNGTGTIFKLTTAGAFNVIRHLDYRNDGGRPTSSLVQGADGALYGTTSQGGTNGYGTIFKITTKGTLTVLHHLEVKTDGGTPMGALYRNSDGNFYGLNSDGGKAFYGTIFKITPSGTYTVLNTFNGASQGNSPSGSIILAKDGAYYGTTNNGGANQHGTIFKICGGVTTVLRSFNKNTDGGFPYDGLVQGTDGSFYGLTSEGGNYNSGTIYRITAGGSFKVLYHFNSSVEGSGPAGSLIQGKDGSFYGTAKYGGPNRGGTIFKITAAGAFKVLWSLTSSSDGSAPDGNLVQGADGNLYGIASSGGTNNNGTIFKISPTGTNFKVMKHFNSLPDGNYPLGSLALGKDGNFYGTTSSGGSTSYDGVIFRITPAGDYKVLKRLSGPTEGEAPKGNLVQASDGNFYGMTSAGGKNNAGTLFRITPSGSYTVLRHFNLTTDGGEPSGSLIVQKPNPLVANAQSTTTAEDKAKAIVLTGSGGSPLTYSIRSNPKNGTLSGTGANRTYTPKPNFTGKDTFTFTVSVGCQVSAPATVTITVSPVNDAPVLASIGKKTVVKGSTLSFTATATDPDAGQTKTFSLVGAPSGATINATSGAFSWKPSIAGSYNFTVKVTDNGSPALSDQEAVSVTVLNSTSSTVRLNTGGEAATSSLGSFSADNYFSGATSISATTSPIANTTDDILYQNNRRATDVGGSFTYNIPVSNGSYTVKLHFAETFYTAAGQRKFNVSAEGASWLSNYDIVAAAGGTKVAVVATKNIKVADGSLTLLFSSVVDKACVAAIEVLPASAAESSEANTNLITSLYPNPAEDFLMVTLQTTGERVQAKITNDQGTVVKTIDQLVDTNKLQVEVAPLKAGLYQLHVQTPTGEQIYRFVKK
ncbi:choice-of-anchor tandem repeat GloVer-containing protein [Adhaeribacter radiodurans]|uniref:Putative Ig domain-containing protein n=1 Tax=Adhaeribacter radiodurans TaxID=2745197 RepID=A0A7L7L9V6_9BACT|nr:choice-of-anchor tandem repeat GloVer-containing protein [Adhaeribacter radiodurans]QMU29621.1 putative Ig domain-containing protein [Adhaeribacter radiodurans]